MFAVFYRRPADDQLRALPAKWTDVIDPDPFVVMAAGRSLFRVEDLLSLGSLLAEMDEGRCK